MNALKIEKIHTLVTVDDEYRILHDVDVLIEDGKIAAVGANLEAPAGARATASLPDRRWRLSAKA